MKKITSLFALLLVFLWSVGASAETIVINSANGSLNNAMGYSNLWTSSGSPTVTLRTAAKNMAKSGEKITMHSGKSGSSDYTISVPNNYKIVSYTFKGTLSSGAVTVTPAGGTATAFAPGVENSFTVDNINAPTATFKIAGSNESFPVQIEVNYEEVTLANVTYKVMDGGREKYSAVVSTGIGTTVSAVPAELQRDFVAYNGFTSFEVPGDTTVVLNATYNLPFTVGEEYYLKIKGTKYVAYQAGATQYKASADFTASADTRWVFEGNPFDGIVVKSVGAGLTAGSLQFGTGNPQYATIQPGETKWKIGRGAASVTNGFVLYQDANNAMNDNADKGLLANWNDARSLTDVGSTFAVMSAKDLAPMVKESFETRVKAVVAAAGTAYQYFVPSAADAQSIKTMYDNYANGSDAVPTTDAQYNQLKDALDNLAYVMPETGYYHLKNRSYSYVIYTDANGLNRLVAAATAEEAQQSPTSVFYVEKKGEGKYTFSVVGQYITGLPDGGDYKEQAPTMSENVADAYEATVRVQSAGHASITFGTKSYQSLHANRSTHILCGWEAASEASQWEFVPATDVTVPVSVSNPTLNKSYVTVGFPFPVKIPANTKVYTLNNQGYGKPITGAIPAKTGAYVVIEGNGAATEQTFEIASESEAAAAVVPADNVLTPVYVPAAIPAESVYGLGKVDDVVSLYKFEAGNLLAGRAIIPVSAIAGSPAKAFDINFGGTTGIATVLTDADGEAAVFDLSGRRVAKATKGVYIVNGKKVLVK